MAQTFIDGTSGPTVVYAQEYTSVWAKRAWSDSWQFMPYLFAVDSVEAAWPSDSSATFRFDYGSFLTLWGDPSAVLIPYALHNWFVKIVVHTIFGEYISWVGILPDETLQMDGWDRSTNITNGVQMIKGVGLESLLNRRHVLGGFIGDTGGGVVYIPSPQRFNRRNTRGQSLMGNRSTSAIGANGTFTLSSDGAVWNNDQIARYVLANYQPTEPEFRLVGQTTALDSIIQEHEFHGNTVRDVLETLIDRKRGLGVQLQTDGVGPVYLRVFSITAEPIYGDGVALPANAQQIDVSIDDDLHVEANLSITSMNAYDYIVVEAEDPIKTCFTVSYADGTLEEGWTALEKADYILATDADRTADALQRVYSHHRVPASFNWAGVSPWVDDQGYVDVNTPGPYWNNDVKFLRYIPFLGDAEATDAEPEFREPFALIEFTASTVAEGEEDEEEEKEVGDEIWQYGYLDRMSIFDLPSGSLRMADREMAVIVKSRVNHVYALNNWSDDAEETAQEPVYDYKSLVVTVNVETDAMLKVRLPIQGGMIGTTTGSEVYIPVSGLEYWIVAPNTVKDVVDGVPVFWGDGPGESMIVRDDSAKLRAIASLAWAWFGQQRGVLELTIKNQLNWHQIGELVRTAWSGTAWENIGTVITSISRNYETQTQVIETGFGEIDPKEFAGIF